MVFAVVARHQQLHFESRRDTVALAVGRVGFRLPCFVPFAPARRGAVEPGAEFHGTALFVERRDVESRETVHGQFRVELRLIEHLYGFGCGLGYGDSDFQVARQEDERSGALRLIGIGGGCDAKILFGIGAGARPGRGCQPFCTVRQLGFDGCRPGIAAAERDGRLIGIGGQRNNLVLRRYDFENLNPPPSFSLSHAANGSTERAIPHKRLNLIG